MAKSSRGRKNDSFVVASEVVQVSLLPEHVASLKTKIVAKGEFYQELFELCKQGYTLNVSYDADREQWSARLAGIDAQCVNAGKLLYGNGNSIENAFLALYGKHFLASGGSTWVGTAPGSSDMS